MIEELGAACVNLLMLRPDLVMLTLLRLASCLLVPGNDYYIPAQRPRTSSASMSPPFELSRLSTRQAYYSTPLRVLYKNI